MAKSKYSPNESKLFYQLLAADKKIALLERKRAVISRPPGRGRNRRRAQGRRNKLPAQFSSDVPLFSSTPMSYDVDVRRYYRITRHVRNGKEYYKLKGMTLWAQVVQGAGPTPGPGPLVSANRAIGALDTAFATAIPLCPNNPKASTVPPAADYRYDTGFLAGSPEKLFTLGFTRYRFRKVKLCYVPRVSTQINGSFYFGYHPDPAVINNGSVGVTQTQISPSTVQSVMYRPKSIDISNFLADAGDTWYWNWYSGGATPSDTAGRTVWQGSIIATWTDYPYINVPTGAAVGNLWLDYELELCDPAIATDLASSTLGLLSDASIGSLRSDQLLSSRAGPDERKEDKKILSDFPPLSGPARPDEEEVLVRVDPQWAKAVGSRINTPAGTPAPPSLLIGRGVIKS